MQTINSNEQREIDTPKRAIIEGGGERAARASDENLQASLHTTPKNGELENFRSILFPDSETIGDKIEPPFYFHDLNLDQVVDAIARDRDEYNLKPIFYTRLTSLAAIIYRQEIMRDLENAALFESVKSFSSQMREMRKHLAAAKSWSYKYAKARWFLDASETYREAVTKLVCNLERSNPHSRGLTYFRNFLKRYVESEQFKYFSDFAKQVKTGLLAIRYCVLIRGGGVTVRPYESEIDYTATVEETFEKFKQGAVKDYLVKTTAFLGMNHVEAAISDRVALLYPDAFHALDDFCAKHEHFLDKTIVAFDREIQFYIAYLEHMKTFECAGLKFCYPQVSGASKEVNSRENFDLALARKLLKENSPVVCNDFFLSGHERIFVVTGPNQGGKTTFARTFGQLHYLASLGCPVPGSEARLFLFDRLFSHFEREEDIKTLRGKMQDDLVRIHQILEQATPNSIVIINEIFSSTSVKDGVQLGKKIMEHLARLDLLGVCVTFLDELASCNEKIVSAVATVVPENPSQRTHKIERKPADGLAYALAIAEKYELTYVRLKERLKP
ncbi:MAG TPA: DNA mismatch repair protein MutS [Verrucomicrobiae bacterium]|nr:DNA mismatch repair protein MutS [Verrucomicrobiae bacterium]